VIDTPPGSIAIEKPAPDPAARARSGERLSVSGMLP
jgi:hypothetical protein